MLASIPFFVSILFCLCVLATVYALLQASHMHRVTRLVVGVWIGLQATLAYNGFYSAIRAHPERLPIAIAPTLFVIVALFATQKGRAYLDTLDSKALTLLHMVRVPVEVTLFYLFTYKAIPQIMTFEGRNFDILSGLTAPIVYYLAFVKGSLGRTGLLAWNVVCLILVITIVTIGLLSAPLPIQQFGMDQPNIGVLYFPFNLLPSFVVPTVIFAHLVEIRRLTKK
jgi:hypothetical protein